LWKIFIRLELGFLQARSGSLPGGIIPLKPFPNSPIVIATSQALLTFPILNPTAAICTKIRRLGEERGMNACSDGR
jgi:hypothetical protein